MQLSSFQWTRSFASLKWKVTGTPRKTLVAAKIKYIFFNILSFKICTGERKKTMESQQKVQ
jgi:hypothetical protein